MICELPILVSKPPALQMVKVHINKPDIFNKKVSIPIAATGDLLSSIYLGWKRLTADEAFKNTCWNFLSMCNKYLQHINIQCKFTTTNFTARISAKRFTRGGFKDELAILVARSGAFYLQRKSTRRGKVAKQEKKLETDFFWFQYRLEPCLKKWQQNSQFQFAIY